MAAHFETANVVLHLFHLIRYDVNINSMKKKGKLLFRSTPTEKTSSIIFKLKQDIISSLCSCSNHSFILTHPPVLHHHI